MSHVDKGRIWVAAFLFCVLAKGFGLPQPETQYLAAGRGQPPFDVTRHSIPVQEIFDGGPPRDAIPALNNAKFVSAAEADKFLDRHHKVLAIEFNGIAKAYPIRILNWHEVVNDDFNGKPVVVTWCPLCLSGIVYDSQNGGKRLTFGVSGKVYKSNLLMYDHETGSLWSQMAQQAVTGPLTGTALKMLSAEHTTWERWRAQHPNTLVLSLDTGFKRDYDLDPYQQYAEEGKPTFRNPQGSKSAKEKIRAMEPVLGVVVGRIPKAYPFAVLKKRSAQFSDQVGDRIVFIHFDKRSQTAWVTAESEAIVPSTTLYWFAWQDFYPQTQILARDR